MPLACDLMLRFYHERHRKASRKGDDLVHHACLPAPALLPLGGARRSCPWRGTGRWRRPERLPQYLAQRPHTGGQRLVTDKRVGPQLLQEFLLGDDPRAMRQQIGEYLKHLAPELYRCTRAPAAPGAPYRGHSHQSCTASPRPQCRWGAHQTPGPSRGSNALRPPPRHPLRLHRRPSYHRVLLKMPRKCPESAPKVSCFLA